MLIDIIDAVIFDTNLSYYILQISLPGSRLLEKQSGIKKSRDTPYTFVYLKAYLQRS